MVNHYLYKDESGNFKIKSNEGNTGFYVYTPDSSEGGGTTPGEVDSFYYYATFTDDNICSTINNSIDFTWTAPLDDGGSPITGYALRRIGTGIYEGSTDVYFSGYPAIVEYYFYNSCEDVHGPPSPVIVGNTTSYSISGMRCDAYSYQIAAINANGTGTFYPNTDWDLAQPNLGYVLAPSSRGYTVTNLGEGSIRINYNSTSCIANGTFSYSSGNLYNWGVDPSPIIDTEVDYSEINAGYVYFAGLSPGLYTVEIFEVWTTEDSGSCTKQIHSCIGNYPFKVTS